MHWILSDPLYWQQCQWKRLHVDNAQYVGEAHAMVDMGATVYDDGDGYTVW